MLQIRPVRDDDRRLLFEWANEEGVRASAFQTAEIPWETHVAWFAGKRRDPNCRMYLVTDGGGQPIAQVRFDVQPDASAEVDVSIARERRGQGLGAAALRLACATLFSETGARRVVAWIRPENAASIHAFARAGFARRDDGVLRGQRAVRMTLDRARAGSDGPGEPR